MKVFWQLAYAFYALGGRAVSSKRSRFWELALFGLAGLIAASWAYALATNYSANVEGVPSTAAIVLALFLGGLFFRHVRMRSAENAHYLAQKKSGR
jgi:hypothetical protein